MIFLILALTGVFVGLLSAFFGVGGGIIIVPVLYYLFADVGPGVVIGTSLTVILLNSLLNTYNFRVLNLKVPSDFGLTLALGMALGILASTEALPHIEPRQIRIFFGLTLFATALRTLFSKTPNVSDLKLSKLNFRSTLLILTLGLAGGLIAGLTGLGGGIVVVPLLMTLQKIPLRLVPAFSNLAMAGGTLVGMIRYTQIAAPDAIKTGILASGQFGSVQLYAALMIFVGSLFSSRLGARLTQKVDQTTSKRLFALLLIVIGSKILYSTLI